MKFLLYISFILFNTIGFSQKIKLESNEQLPKLKYQDEFVSDADLTLNKRNIITQLQNKGYIAAGIDSVKKTTDLITIYIYTGAKFEWGKLQTKNIGDDALNYSGFKEKLFENKKLSPYEISKLSEKILTFYENNGYPFAELKLDSLTNEGATINGLLIGNRNQLIKIDSIIIKSEEELNKNLIQNIIELKEGEVYNERKIRLISNKILESGLYTESAKWQMIFGKKESKLYLFLKSDKSSQFNGIAGVQPDPVTKKISVTGDVNLHLKNVLKRAENINLEWKKFGDISQELTTSFAYPYILNSQFGTDLSLHLYKRDTTFIELEQKIEMQYLFSNTNVFKIFTKKYESNTLSTFLSESFSNVKINYYGVGLKQTRVNYIFNPLKGYGLDITSSIGNKTNNKLESTTGDLLEIKSTQGLIESKVFGYIPIGKKSTIKIQNQTNYIISDNIYENELYRFGGLKTLRGFDEESLSASFASISTLELRYLFERNSNAYIFIDGGFIESNVVETYKNNMPIGTGVGVNFETGAGIFTISYAVGKLSNTSFLLRSAKIHFGFVAIF